MNQLILHLIGDYALQSDWMASNKTKRSWPAFCHSLIYSLPFLLIGSVLAWAVILVTHFLIDRFRLAVYVAWAKNLVLGHWLKWFMWDSEDLEVYSSVEGNPKFFEYCEDCVRFSWKNCKSNGYPSDVPPWLAVWLLIACDNTLHLAINYLALAWL